MVPTQLPQTHTQHQEQLRVLWMAGAELGITGHILKKKAPGEEESGGAARLHHTLPHLNPPKLQQESLVLPALPPSLTLFLLLPIAAIKIN